MSDERIAMESTKFDRSRWADRKFSQDYRDEASYYLPFRQLFVEVTKSVVEHFLAHKTTIKLLDLGCGDGFFVERFNPGPDDDVVLIDGSNEMLEASKRRLSTYGNIRYIRSSFQELVMSDPLSEKFDLVFSSLAIHHLVQNDKFNLYRYIYDHLEENGIFINYDVVLAPSDRLEDWYISFWQQYIDRNDQTEINDRMKMIPYSYKDNPDNVPDTLEDQINALKKIGFSNIDCYFKFGVFCLFGGTK